MSWMKENRWALVVAGLFFTGSIVAVTSFVTLQWAENEDVVREVGETLEGILLEPEADPKADELNVYDLPDHGGRLVADDDGDHFGLPQVKADYDVDIRGDLATVTVEQTFENPTDKTLHPTYQFPLYSEAAVYAMEMTIGDRTIRADVKRKEEAREDYEAAKRQGKKAALLSFERPNLFTQRVANLGAGEQVDIEIRYTHTVPKDEGAYRLAVPLAVGERFTPPDMSDNALVDGQDPQPGPTSPTREAGDISLQVRIDGGMPISRVRSSTHAVRMEKLSEVDRRIELAGERVPADRHFRMRYRLGGEETMAGLNAHWDEEEKAGYFNLRIEPPFHPASDPSIDREMVFVIDKSGSMRGGPLRDTKQFVSRAIEQLRPNDRFRIILFSNQATGFADEPVRATDENVERAQRFLQELRAGGGTMMARGIDRALGPDVADGTIRLVTFLTDGRVSNEFAIIKQLRRQVGQARMFAVGVGHMPNGFLLEEMGRAGRGFTKVLVPGAANDELIDDAVRRLQTPVLTDVSVDWGEAAVEGVTPTEPPDVFGAGTVRIHGRYSKPGDYRLTVRGKSGGQPVELPIDVTFPETASDGEAVKLAWARQQIADAMHALETDDSLRALGQSDEELKERIIDLALRYDLSSQWTSFVAIDESGELAERQESSPEESLAVGPPGSSGILKKKRLHQHPEINLKSGGVKGAPSDAVTALRKLGVSGVGRGGGGGIGQLAKPSNSGSKYANGKGGLLGGSVKSGPQPRVVPRRSTVSGALDREIIRRVVRKHRRELKYCYEKEFQKDESLAGRLKVAFIIASDGSVKSVRVLKSDLNNTAVSRCVQQKIRRWMFPKPKGGGVVRVTYPFEFSAR